jgi:hypothetical protein
MRIPERIVVDTNVVDTNVVDTNVVDTNVLVSGPAFDVRPVSSCLGKQELLGSQFFDRIP